MLPHVPDLAGRIGIISLAEVLFIQRLEYLGHIDAVQPHLVRIDILVPVVAGRGPRLFPQRFPQDIRSLPVLFLSGLLIQFKQHPAFVDVVQSVLLRVICLDGAVLQDEPVNV